MVGENRLGVRREHAVQLRLDTYKKGQEKCCENSPVLGPGVARAAGRERSDHKGRHTHPPNPHFLATLGKDDGEVDGGILVPG